MNAKASSVGSRRMLRTVLLAIIVAIAATVFLPAQQIVDSLTADPTVKLHRDVRFGAGRAELLMDIAAPAHGKGPFPTLVFIHGGGWRSDGDAFHTEIYHAARRGYVAARIRYRLLSLRKDGSTKNAFPAQLDDVMASLAFLQQHAREYRVDPHRIGLVGMSSGGHLALLAGLDGAPRGGPACDVRAIVNFFGPSDLRRAYKYYPESRPLLRQLLGGDPDRTSGIYDAASPIHLASRKSPPVLTIHGSDDPVVPLSQSTLLDQRMREVGGQHTLKVLQGEAHGFSAPGMQQATEVMYVFLDRHLHPRNNAEVTAHRNSRLQQAGAEQ